jgi:hypothetical protein
MAIVHVQLPLLSERRLGAGQLCWSSSIMYYYGYYTLAVRI